MFFCSHRKAAIASMTPKFAVSRRFRLLGGFRVGKEAEGTHLVIERHHDPPFCASAAASYIGCHPEPNANTISTGFALGEVFLRAICAALR